MSEALARRIAAAYRWHRRLGAAAVIETPSCAIVADASKPQVWDCNHADDVTARDGVECDAVFVAMDRHLGHTNWRVVHTDGFTPDAFLARLAFADFRERPATIQMALQGEVAHAGAPLDLRAVESAADWAALQALVFANHLEGKTTAGLEIEAETSAGMVANYRAKAPQCRFHLAFMDGRPIAYGAVAAAPGGLGMLEDLFTLTSHRRRGVASAMIAAFVDDARRRGCDAVFLGAVADEAAKRLYRRLGFVPAALARSWVKDLGAPLEAPAAA
jgi:ribosomal protein S18 acetylase RimI-like enzyme